MLKNCYLQYNKIKFFPTFSLVAKKKNVESKGIVFPFFLKQDKCATYRNMTKNSNNSFNGRMWKETWLTTVSTVFLQRNGALNIKLDGLNGARYGKDK